MHTLDVLEGMYRRLQLADIQVRGYRTLDDHAGNPRVRVQIVDSRQQNRRRHIGRVDLLLECDPHGLGDPLLIANVEHRRFRIANGEGHEPGRPTQLGEGCHLILDLFPDLLADRTAVQALVVDSSSRHCLPASASSRSSADSGARQLCLLRYPGTVKTALKGPTACVQDA